MTELLPLDEPCKGCGCSTAETPAGFGEGAWLTCSSCHEPVVPWEDYKRAALETAARRIRDRATPNKWRGGLHR
jgi:hypothetical protein